MRKWKLTPKPFLVWGLVWQKAKSDWWGLAKLSLQFCSQSLLQEIVSSWVCFHTFEFPHCLELPGKTEIANRSFCEHAESKYKVKSGTVFYSCVQPWYQIDECTKENACSYLTQTQTTMKVIFILSPSFILDFQRHSFLLGHVWLGQDFAYREKQELCCGFPGEVYSWPVHQGHTSEPRSMKTGLCCSSFQHVCSVPLCWDW